MTAKLFLEQLQPLLAEHSKRELLLASDVDLQEGQDGLRLPLRRVAAVRKERVIRLFVDPVAQLNPGPLTLAALVDLLRPLASAHPRFDVVATLEVQEAGQTRPIDLPVASIVADKTRLLLGMVGFEQCRRFLGKPDN